MQKKSGFITLLVSVIALCLSVFSLLTVFRICEDKTTDVQYVMYIGTNDKDTNTPVGTSDEVKAKAEEILVSHFGGYTIQEAAGGWADDKGTLYQEYTIVVYSRGQ